MSDKENQDFYEEDSVGSVLVDSLGATVKRLVEKGKERGYITVEELNKALPLEKESSEKIEDIMSSISDMGINIISESEVDSYDGESDAVDEDVDEDDKQFE